MPSKNSLKVYVADGFYHLYNRGVEKRKIFLDNQDYSVFLGYLKDYLSPKDTVMLNGKLADPALDLHERDKVLRLLRLNNFHDQISLLSFCLMPNHFHMQVRQTEPEAIDLFINSLNTRYVMYFNKKYQRVGHLYQDVYKAVLIENEEQLLHLSRYIHRNPLKLRERGNAHQNLYTSLLEYLGLRKTKWIETETILSYFSKTQRGLTYKDFVDETDERERIEKLIIEDYED